MIAEAEETETTTISELGQQKKSELERRVARAAMQDEQAAFIAEHGANHTEYIPVPLPPQATDRHPLLLQQLHNVINAYRAEHQIDDHDVLTIINEFYYELAGGER